MLGNTLSNHPPALCICWCIVAGACRYLESEIYQDDDISALSDLRSDVMMHTLSHSPLTCYCLNDGVCSTLLTVHMHTFPGLTASDKMFLTHSLFKSSFCCFVELLLYILIFPDRMEPCGDNRWFHFDTSAQVEAERSEARNCNQNKK